MGGLVLKETFLLNGKLERTLQVGLFSLMASSISSSDFVHNSILNVYFPHHSALGSHCKSRYKQREQILGCLRFPPQHPLCLTFELRSACASRKDDQSLCENLTQLAWPVPSPTALLPL